MVSFADGKGAFRAAALASILSTAVAFSSVGGPVDLVNTGIGSISHMLVPTFRTVQRPGPSGSRRVSVLSQERRREETVARNLGPGTRDTLFV